LMDGLSSGGQHIAENKNDVCIAMCYIDRVPMQRSALAHAA